MSYKSLALTIAMAGLMSGAVYAKADKGAGAGAGAGAPSFSPEQTEFLRELATATAAGAFLYASQEVGQSLVAANLIAINPELKDENGNVAAKLTDAGNAWLVANPATGNETKTETKTPAVKQVFEVELGVPMGVKGKRGGRKDGSMYPFDSLPAPTLNTDPATKDANPWLFGSFHVAPKEGKTVEQVKKSLSSTVSQQNSARAVEVVGEDGKPMQETVTIRGKTITRNKTRQDIEFIVLAANATDPKGEGVRVYRVDGKLSK